jgi:hypothetical protein
MAGRTVANFIDKQTVGREWADNEKRVGRGSEESGKRVGREWKESGKRVGREWEGHQYNGILTQPCANARGFTSVLWYGPMINDCFGPQSCRRQVALKTLAAGGVVVGINKWIRR